MHQWYEGGGNKRRREAGPQPGAPSLCAGATRRKASWPNAAAARLRTRLDVASDGWLLAGLAGGRMFGRSSSVSAVVFSWSLESDSCSAGADNNSFNNQEAAVWSARKKQTHARTHTHMHIYTHTHSRRGSSPSEASQTSSASELAPHATMRGRSKSRRGGPS